MCSSGKLLNVMQCWCVIYFLIQLHQKRSIVILIINVLYHDCCGMAWICETFNDRYSYQNGEHEIHHGYLGNLMLLYTKRNISICIFPKGCMFAKGWLNLGNWICFDETWKAGFLCLIEQWQGWSHRHEGWHDEA